MSIDFAEEYTRVTDVKQFKLPDVGEGLTEAEIVSWKVKPGDHVEINDVIVEIETAKSLVELPSPFAGVVSELMVPEGETVDVGTAIIAVDTDPSGAAAAAAAGNSAVGTAPSGTAIADLVPEVRRPAEGEPVEPGLSGGPAPGGRTSVLVGYGPRETSAKRRPRKVADGAGTPASEALPSSSSDVASQEDAPSPVMSVASAGDGSTSKVFAKPTVRKLARDLGVDLDSVLPTGPNDTVTRADVQAAAAAAGSDERTGTSDASAAEEVDLALSAPGAHPADRELRVPVRGVRKMTARAMVDSAFSAPHVTVFSTVDVTRTVKLVERLRAHRDFRDVRVSPLLILAKAMLVAIRRTPELNSTWDEAAQEIVVKHYVNLGIAAATPRGLIVPNIKDADAMSLRELAVALSALVATARDGRTPPADMQRGTITITNVGVFGVDTGTPIINPGETAILAFGAIREQPWVVRGKVRPRHVTTLGLSFDHRVVDGEQGSRFLSDVAAVMTDPGLAMALG